MIDYSLKSHYGLKMIHQGLTAAICFLGIGNLTLHGVEDNEEPFVSRAIKQSLNTTQAHVSVWAKQCASHAIPRYITGKFAEHLGANLWHSFQSKVYRRAGKPFGVNWNCLPMCLLKGFIDFQLWPISREDSDPACALASFRPFARRRPGCCSMVAAEPVASITMA